MCVEKLRVHQIERICRWAAVLWVLTIVVVLSRRRRNHVSVRHCMLRRVMRRVLRGILSPMLRIIRVLLLLGRVSVLRRVLRSVLCGRIGRLLRGVTWMVGMR